MGGVFKRGQTSNGGPTTYREHVGPEPLRPRKIRIKKIEPVIEAKK